MKRKKNILCPLRSTRLESAKGLLLCYAVCVILFLGFKLCAGLWVFYGFQNGRYAQRNLTLNDFEQYGVEQLDDMTMVNATDDTQLWITENIYNLYVDCDFSYDPGEFLAFYSYKADGVFSAERCVRGKQYGRYYVFEFPIGTNQIRVDTGFILPLQYLFRKSWQINTHSILLCVFLPGSCFICLRCRE